MNSALSVATDTSAAARYFRVLGDATRLMIIGALIDGDRTVGELVDLVGQAQPRISTHLACLRHCGFVTTERRGKEAVYGLALQGLDGAGKDAPEPLTPILDRLRPSLPSGRDGGQVSG